MNWTILLLAAQLTVGGVPAGRCTGDCDGDGELSISELIRGVNIALGSASLNTCPGFDSDGNGNASINELVKAVSDALFGCGVRPPTRTPTSVPTNTVPRLPTATFVPTATAVPQGTPTPEGLLFDGLIEELIPHEAGDFLSYRVTRSSQSATSTEVRRVVDQVGLIFVVETREGGSIEEEEFVDRGDELVLRATDDLDDNLETRCAPPLVQLISPMFSGEAFSTNSQCTLRTIPGGVFLGSVPQSNRVVPQDLVPSLTVPAGTYDNVIRLTSTFNFQGGVEVNEFWIVPGIGIIRSVQETDVVTVTRELVEGMIGGQPVGR